MFHGLCRLATNAAFCRKASDASSILKSKLPAKHQNLTDAGDGSFCESARHRGDFEILDSPPRRDQNLTTREIVHKLTAVLDYDEHVFQSRTAEEVHLEEAWNTLANRTEIPPYASVNQLQKQTNMMTEDQPDLARFDAKVMVDNFLIKKLEDSGWIKKLFGR